MKKSRLDLDALDVESFATSAPVPRAGTVVAFDSGNTAAYYSCDAWCSDQQTKDVENTCDFQCDGGGGGTTFATRHTACLDCYTNANTCTMVDGCHYVTQDDTCTCPA